MIVLPFLAFRCLAAVNFLWHFLVRLCVGVKYVIAIFSDHTHLLSESFTKMKAVFRDSYTSFV